MDATFQAGNATFLPKTVTVQRDATVQVRRLIAIDKTDLPEGTRIDPATGKIIIPTWVQMGNVESATNTTNGQLLPISAFVTTGTVLIIDTRQLEPILSKGTNTMELITENTIVTIIAEKGSVIIKSIKMEPRFKVPEAPNATIDDTNNTIILPAGVTADQLEIATTTVGPFTAFDPNKKYTGDQVQYLRIKAIGKIPASKTIELKFTNSAPKITSAASVNSEFFATKGGVISAMTVVDADGDALTYSLSDLTDAAKQGIVIDAKTGVITIL